MIVFQAYTRVFHSHNWISLEFISLTRLNFCDNGSPGANVRGGGTTQSKLCAFIRNAFYLRGKGYNTAITVVPKTVLELARPSPELCQRELGIITVEIVTLPVEWPCRTVYRKALLQFNKILDAHGN